jgi:hypothetical protein
VKVKTVESFLQRSKLLGRKTVLECIKQHLPLSLHLWAEFDGLPGPLSTQRLKTQKVSNVGIYQLTYIPIFLFFKKQGSKAYPVTGCECRNAENCGSESGASGSRN